MYLVLARTEKQEGNCRDFKGVASNPEIAEMVQRLLQCSWPLGCSRRSWGSFWELKVWVEGVGLQGVGCAACFARAAA